MIGLIIGIISLAISLANGLVVQDQKSLNQKQIYLVKQPSQPIQCETVPRLSRFDCHPAKDATESVCLARGCCWSPILSKEKAHDGVPWCHYPAGYVSHTVTDIEEKEFGVDVTYSRIAESGYPGDFDNLKMEISLKGNGMISVQINPLDEVIKPNPYLKNSDHIPGGIKDKDIVIEVSEHNFGFRISRLSTGQIL